MRTNIAVLLASAWLAPAFAQPAPPPGSYECRVDMAVGFTFSEGSRSWTPTTFGNGAIYIFRPLTDKELQSAILFPKGATWGVFETDGSHFLDCVEADQRLTCGGMAVSFMVNTTTFRFQRYYAGQYLNGRDNSDDTPFVEIGRCTQRR